MLDRQREPCPLIPRPFSVRLAPETPLQRTDTLGLRKRARSQVSAFAVPRLGETYAYSAGNIVQSFHDNGRSLLFDWSASGSLERVRDGVGRAVEYTYDSDDRLETVTSADGKVTTYAYDSVGRLSSMSVPSASSPSTTVSFAYDPSDRVTTVTQQPGIETSFAYSDGETVVTDPNGNAATYEIDSSGRVTSTEDALGRSRSQEWTANSDIASSTDAIGTNTTIYTYDGSNNRTSAELPTGAAASAVYAVGTDCAAPDTGTAFQAKCSTDDAGNEKQYEYDAAGNQTKQTDTTGSTPGVEFERTYGECSGSHGQICTATDGNGNTTTYAYNADGNLTTVTPPGPLGATTYTHDSLGRVTSVTDGNGDTTGYQYDVRDRIVLTTFENGQNLVTAYYPNGLEESRTDSAGGTVAFEYDHQGRITSQTGPGSGISQTYQYDNVGNMTSHADAGGSTYYGYDDANQLIRLSESGSICMPGDTTLPSTRCIKFQYDDNALEIARRFPGGSTFTERDDSGRPTRITARVGGTDVVDIGYSYTQDGEDRTLVQTRTSHAEEGIAAGAVTTYTYDSRERLILAEEKDGSAVSALWAYAYDDNSNRTQQIRSGDTGAAAGTIDYAYNAANQITSATGQTTTWTYDAAGNQTRNGLTGDTTTYGDRGEATTFGTTNADYFATGNTDRLQFGGVSFTNSALGTMQRTEGATTDNYTRTPDGEIIGTRNSPDRYYIKDHLGSVVGMISDDGTYYGGYSYSPYGETRAVGTDSTVIANPIRYIGEHHDGDGIYKLGARYYDTSLGRFTQMDPSGQEANPYAYAGCNPINAVDSTGLSTTFWPCAGALLGVVGSVALLAAEIAAFVALAVVPDVTITKAGAVIIGLTLGGTATLAASAAINAFVTCG